jgi:hypothetical protein
MFVLQEPEGPFSVCFFVCQEANLLYCNNVDCVMEAHS